MPDMPLKILQEMMNQRDPARLVMHFGRATPASHPMGNDGEVRR
ncbi:hypothetical protein [Methylobacterium sp.]|nr:hypothetical protein [Methylobacterium sp.]